jgi:hypothetical protein
MVWQDADATEITRVSDMCRRGQTGKSDRHTIVAKGQPPVTGRHQIRHGSIFKEGQSMEIPQQVRDVVVESINLANPVHRQSLSRKTKSVDATSTSLDEAGSKNRNLYLNKASNSDSSRKPNRTVPYR